MATPKAEIKDPIEIPQTSMKAISLPVTSISFGFTIVNDNINNPLAKYPCVNQNRMLFTIFTTSVLKKATLKQDRKMVTRKTSLTQGQMIRIGLLKVGKYEFVSLPAKLAKLVIKTMNQTYQSGFLMNESPAWSQSPGLVIQAII